MTPQQLKEKMNSPKLREIVQKQTNLLCDAYQQGWEIVGIYLFNGLKKGGLSYD